LHSAVSTQDEGQEAHPLALFTFSGRWAKITIRTIAASEPALALVCRLWGEMKLRLLTGVPVEWFEDGHWIFMQKVR